MRFSEHDRARVAEKHHKCSYPTLPIKDVEMEFAPLSSVQIVDHFTPSSINSDTNQQGVSASTPTGANESAFWYA